MNHSLPRKSPRMKTAFLFSLFALLALVDSPVLAADYNVAVFFTGNFNGSYSPPFGTNTFEGLDVSTTPNPGFELLIKPTSRLSVGVAFQRMQFDSSASHLDSVTDSFWYVDGEGNVVTVDMPGTVFASYDLTTSVKDFNVVTGNVYLNFTTEGNIQPFIGGGYGIGFGDRVQRYETFVHPLFAELKGFEFQLSNSSIDTKVGVATAKFGVNVYLKNFVFGGVGGYQNGPLGQFRIGVAF